MFRPFLCADANARREHGFPAKPVATVENSSLDELDGVGASGRYLVPNVPFPVKLHEIAAPEVRNPDHAVCVERPPVINANEKGAVPCRDVGDVRNGQRVPVIAGNPDTMPWPKVANGKERI